MKILASADFHLGKQSSCVASGGRESSVTFTWKRMVNYAVEHKIDALALAGDVIDRDNRFFEAIGPVQWGFETLGNAGIPVVMVSGNHDYDVLPDIIRNRAYNHVHLLGEKGEWEAKTIETRSGKLQFLGWSFPAQHVREDPLLQLKSADIGLDPNLPAIGLLHGDFYDQKSHYAPLGQAGFNFKKTHAWVIGHIHKPAILREQGPLVLYPGSPQALSPKEPGVHGPYLLTIDGNSINARQAPLSPVRYETITIDISKADTESAFRNLVTQGLYNDIQNMAGELDEVIQVIYDVVMAGRHSDMKLLEKWLHLADSFEQEMIDETTVSIRKIVNRAEPSVENLEKLAGQSTPPGILAKAILGLEAGNSSDFLEEILLELADSIGNVNRSRTYQPLNQYEELFPETEETARNLLLNESRNLLGELLAQKSEGNQP